MEKAVSAVQERRPVEVSASQTLHMATQDSVCQPPFHLPAAVPCGPVFSSCLCFVPLNHLSCFYPKDPFWFSFQSSIYLLRGFQSFSTLTLLVVVRLCSEWSLRKTGLRAWLAAS